MAFPRSFFIASPLDQDSVRVALASPAEAVLLDLARCPGEEARREAGYVISGRPAGRVWALINRLDGPGGEDDCAALVGPGLAGVFLPDARGPQDIRDLGVVLRQREMAAGIEPGAVLAVPVVQSARGILRLADIAEASPRLAGLAIDRGALARDLSGGVEGFGAKYAAGELAVVARAFKLAAVEASACSEGKQASDLAKVRNDGYGAAVVASAEEASLVNHLFGAA
jgi:citrate lyase beta subunit